ncbi:MAG: family 78 glycoside hydrolase catalytic domain [Lachnospiraceae bacterium]
MISRKWRRSVASVVCAAVMTATIPVLANEVKADNTAPEKPDTLRTELLKSAYGIDTKNPSFSWVVHDADKNEYQSAYRIIVSDTSALKGDVYDSGWMNSSASTNVHVDVLETLLKNNEIYYWQVQTKDKDGAESPLSEPAVFMTDIADEWQSTAGIWSVAGAGISTNKAVIEQTMSVTAGGALGMLLRMTDSNSGYMAQYRTVDNEIRIQKINDNKSIETTAFQTLKLSDSGITLPTDQTEFRTKIELNGSNITFYVQQDIANGKSNYIKAGTVDISANGNITDGSFGYRTGRTESGTIDDLKVTDASGNVIYQSSFDSAADQFEGMTVSNGKLQIPVSVFGVYADDTERSNFAFIRSPKLKIDNTDQIDKAVISAACRGTGTDRNSIFDLYFNGNCIGAGSGREVKGVGSFGGTSNYRKIYYNSYDVTELLSNGTANVISAVGNSRDAARSILIQMTVFYKDGTKKILTNSSVDNSGWKTLDGTKAFADDGSRITTGYVSILHDNYDAEYYPTGFYDTEFDDSAWNDAQVTYQSADHAYGVYSDGSSVLYPYPAENVLRIVTKEPEKKVYRNNSGNLIIDLGKEIIGGLKVNLNSSIDQNITIRRGEEVNTDGTVKYKLTAVPTYEDVWKLKKGSNQFETVTMRNFRYVELIGLDDTTEDAIINNPDSILGWAMEQAFDEEISDFTADDGSEASTLLNRLYDLSKYSIKATDQDVYTDSQARERAPYEGDLLVNSNTSYSVIDQYALARHSNEWLIDNPTWPNDYSLFSVEMAYWDYIYTGNTDSISEYYDALKKKLTVKVNKEDSATGLIRANGSQAGNSAIIDWPVSERDGYQTGYYDVVYNSEYVGIYQCMAELSTALGKTEDAENYQKKADKLKTTLLQYAYDSDNGCFYDALQEDLTPVKHSSTHASAYALTYGVFKDQAMADELSAFVYENCKTEFKGSVYATYFILKGLYKGNHGDYAEKLMTNPKVGTDVKTFASLLDDLNCTITPEAWGHKYKGNMTLSHPWGASPGCSIVQGMFGIIPVKAGFEEFTIKLQPGSITAASVKAPSIRGTIEASYQYELQEGLEMETVTAEVFIPVNTTAHVYVPSEENTVLRVDGKKTDVEAEDGYFAVRLGSGNHRLAVVSPNSEDEKDDSGKDDTGKDDPNKDNTDKDNTNKNDQNSQTPSQPSDKPSTDVPAGDNNTQTQPSASDQQKEQAQAGTVSLAESAKTVTSANTDRGDIAGSSFMTFKLKAKEGNKSVKLSWDKVKGAEGYVIYGAACGSKLEQIAKVSGSKKSYTVKKLKKNKYYKYVVTAYQTIYGEERVTATSVSVHCATKGGKYGNPTGITNVKKTISVKKGKTVSVKPKLKTKGKVKTHIAKFRFESSNPAIATINKKGKIKGIKKGTCTVYVYTQNGLYKKATVKVK